MNISKKMIANVVGIGATTYAVNAFAYIDPGTGSILLQGAIAAIAGAAIAIKLYWYRLKSFFGLKKKNEEKNDFVQDSIEQDRKED